VTAHYADVSDPASVDACVAEIIASHGKIDSLVTSAGFTENFEAVAYPVDRMRKLWAVNVDGTYLFATAVARHLVGLYLSFLVYSPVRELCRCWGKKGWVRGRNVAGKRGVCLSPLLFHATGHHFLLDLC
jgi:NAD(P)-dependent dehydrogenase (short-subunit alcohol dehydrogenase family)